MSGDRADQWDGATGAPGEISLSLAVPPQIQPDRVGKDLQRFQNLVLDVIDRWGLPTEGIIVAVRERERLLKNIPDVLEKLDEVQRARASYVTKMILAASVGLFDAALNYLWSETINELRTRVADFDVVYFFDLAEPDPVRRSDLSTSADLVKIDNVKLMEAANRIKLISDVGHKQLDHIRYMRDNVNAAHSNQAALTGLKLAEWLQTCIHEVITLPRDTVVAQIGRLLYNIKSQRLPRNELANAAIFFDQLPLDQADNLAAGLFGIYIPPDVTPDTQDNIRQLWLALWPHISESARNECGVKLARFRANADHDRAQRARELLDLVDGTAYLPESDRAVEISQALDELHSRHVNWNNFYEEPSVAKRLLDLVGRYGQVPTQISLRYVHEIVYVFLTNGHGVARAADPIYRKLIRRFDSDQAAMALRSFSYTPISSRLQFDLPGAKWVELLDLIDPKLTARRDRALLESVRAFVGTPDQLMTDQAIKQQLEIAEIKRT